MPRECGTNHQTPPANIILNDETLGAFSSKNRNVRMFPLTIYIHQSIVGPNHCSKTRRKKKNIRIGKTEIKVNIIVHKENLQMIRVVVFSRVLDTRSYYKSQTPFLYTSNK